MSEYLDDPDDTGARFYVISPDGLDTYGGPYREPWQAADRQADLRHERPRQPARVALEHRPGFD